ncbi:unnamed protein product [Echinostoma caproni]|uniref:G_PROTEIN_RECEP_F1_2 domain-containing protein n=1 Tax=Echinostoma caproni TaxID=27848 RepID=A0A183BBY6_9TREM|nr:unnamed protein product [Echinostoma caproni]
MNSTAVTDETYYVQNLIVGLLGVANIVLGLTGSVIWLIYLSCNTRGQHRLPPHGSGDLPETQKSNCDPAQTESDVRYEWPVCPLRRSTRLFMITMCLSDLLGLFTSNLRFTVLSLTRSDMRLKWGDNLCRLQILLAYLAGDMATWLQMIVCMERFLIILRPTWSYSLDRSRIRPAIALILTVLMATLIANVFIVLPEEKVCERSYSNLIITWFKMVYSFLVPLPLLSISLIGVTVLLIIRTQSTCLSGPLKKLFPNRGSIENFPSEAIYASQLMLIMGLVTLATSLAILINVTQHATYCCTLTAFTNGTWEDLRFNAISLSFYTAICVRSCMLIVSSSRTRGDIGQIVRLLVRCVPCRRIRCSL